MKVAKPPQISPTTVGKFQNQFSASRESLSLRRTKHSGIFENESVKTSKIEQSRSEGLNGENKTKVKKFSTNGIGIKKTFLEEIREKKTQLKKTEYRNKDSVSVSGKNKSNVGVKIKDGFDSDSSVESDTSVNFWVNTPNMRGGGKVPVKR